MSEWIPVGERLPWCNTQVIAMSVEHKAPRCWIAIYNEDGEWWAQITTNQEEIANVTHWMPIPEAPNT